MPVDERVLTRKGYEQLERELNKLEKITLPEIAERLTDLKSEVESEQEDTELFELLNRKDYVDDRIANIKRILATSIIQDQDPDPDRATAGDRIVVFDMQYKEEMVFDLLDSAEIVHGRQGISTDSPVGSALLGKKIGDVVVVNVPDGVARYKILRFEQID